MLRSALAKDVTFQVILFNVAAIHFSAVWLGFMGLACLVLFCFSSKVAFAKKTLASRICTYGLKLGAFKKEINQSVNMLSRRPRA